MGYPTTADLVAASTVDELTGLEAAQQDALRTSAISAIELYCRQTFDFEGTVEAPITKRVDGSGTPRVVLPRRLSAIVDLEVYGQAVAVTDYQVDPEGDAIELVNPIGGSWLTRVRRSPDDPSPVFDRGTGVVEISGVWGWSEADWADGLLEPVTTAIRLDMEDNALADANRLASTVRSARALGVSSIAQGGLSMSMRRREPTISGRVRRELAGLRWRGPVGAIA